MDVLLKLLHHPGNIRGIQERKLRPPIMVDVDPVDGVCNLDCAWCCQAASRSSRPAKFMTREMMRDLGSFCGRWGVKSWRISGDSEPLLNKDINYLIEAGSANNIEMGLITNGVFLERLTKESLATLTYLGVSLDASTAETWSLLKQDTPDNFRKIVDNIKCVRRLVPSLDISLKFVKWDTNVNLAHNDFGTRQLPSSDLRTAQEAGNRSEVDGLVALAEQLGVKPRIKEAFWFGMSDGYRFEMCHATPLGGVFDASHKFHLCCDARNRFVLTDDYTRDNWQELPRLWNSKRHWDLMKSIRPKECKGCAKYKLNEVLEGMVVSPTPQMQVNFI